MAILSLVWLLGHIRYRGGGSKFPSDMDLDVRGRVYLRFQEAILNQESLG